MSPAGTALRGPVGEEYSCEDSPRSRVRAGVVGGAGYTGAELLSLLERHPEVDVTWATSRSRAGEASPVAGLRYSSPGSMDPAGADVVFLCLPHGEAASRVPALLDAGVRVVDLTADHRPGSGREAGAVYGLPELNGAEVAGADLVANPGCYATAVILSLRPLLDAGLVDPERTTTVVAASGVTGAGRTPRPDLLFAEVAGDYRPYSLGNGHRHLSEMRRSLHGAELLFVPHLLPVARGIVATVAVPVRPGVDAGGIGDAWRETYPAAAGGRGPVRVSESPPRLADVVGTDRLHLSAWENDGLTEPTVTVVAALDNLGKGAAGQAVQNMNLMAGLPPWSGLRC